MALQVKGYKALAVPLGPDEAAPFTAFVYVRQHYSKGEEDLPQGRTLFLANVPMRVGLDTAAYLREAFGRYGQVEDVRLKDRPTRTTSGEGNAAAADEALAVLQEGGGARCAIGFVVFRASKGLKAVLADGAGRLAAPTTSTSQGREKDGDAAQRLLRRFRARQPQVRALQAEVDAAMAAFEAAEAEEARRRKEAAEQPDADGFVTVTYGRKKRRRGGEGDGGAGAKRRGGGRVKRRKQGKELQNFYAHQIREAKREQLAKLRAKFEEDKQRIERMKAARKFRPFG